MNDDVRVIKKRPAKVETLALVRALFSDENPRPLVFFELKKMLFLEIYRAESQR